VSVLIGNLQGRISAFRNYATAQEKLAARSDTRSLVLIRLVAMNRGRGRWRDEDVRAVARTAEALKPLARGVAEALKPNLPRLGRRMRDLDLEPENEEYKTLEATANLAQDPDDAAIDRAIELDIGQLPDDEREVLRDRIRSRLNRPLARRY
jgi:hypothetical protein